jgi:hypothetical protein
VSYTTSWLFGLTMLLIFKSDLEWIVAGMICWTYSLRWNSATVLLKFCCQVVKAFFVLFSSELIWSIYWFLHVYPYMHSLVLNQNLQQKSSDAVQTMLLKCPPIEGPRQPEHHCRSHPYHCHARNQFKICSLNVLV